MARRSYISGQQRVRNVSLSSIMRSKAFRLGFETAARGEGWPREYDRMNMKDQWDFERGRMLGVLCPKLTLKAGSRVLLTAQKAFAFGFQIKSII